MRVHSFSLIEMLIVLVIIGLVSAVAVPAYTQYAIVSRIMTSAKLLQDYMNQSITYAAQHGSFANAYNLQLTTSSAYPNNESGDESLVPSIFSNYLPNGGGTNNTNLQAFDIGEGASSNGCGSAGMVAIALDANALGFSNGTDINNHRGFLLECDFWHNNGAIDKLCLYSYSTSSGAVKDSILPGWLNYNTNATYVASIDPMANVNLTDYSCQ